MNTQLFIPQLFIPLSEGFLLGLGLIVGIGPQNAFVLQQSMRRRFVLMIAFLTSLTDVGLITLGAGGAGRFFASVPLLMQVTTWVGALFLFVYGAKSFQAAVRPRPLALSTPGEQGQLGRRAVVVSLLAVSFLNPGTYLDTLLIIGGSAAQYESSLRLFFTVGATLASVFWFFTLAFSAANTKLLCTPVSLRVIDGFSGGVMWFIAFRLVQHAL